MKNNILLFIFMLTSLTSCAGIKTSSENRPINRNGFIFVEQGVEFAVYPDGQFDFYFNPNNPSRTSIIAPGHIMTYNSAYNYGPYVQYDDYGAVIQIETVPIYYDFYGRIIRAGNIPIAYNNFGKIARIGNLQVFYNPQIQIVNTSGFINSYNRRYIEKPWHSYYRRPYNRNVIVYHQPYRAYYFPERIAYLRYKNHYRKYRKSYTDFYHPGDQVSSYHHGRRTDNVRDLSEINNNFSETYRSGRLNSNAERSNQNTERVRKNNRNSNDASVRRARKSRETSIRERNDRRNKRATIRKNKSSRNQKVERSNRAQDNNVQRPVRRTRRGNETTVRSPSRTSKAAPAQRSRSSRGRE